MVLEVDSSLRSGSKLDVSLGVSLSQFVSRIVPGLVTRYGSHLDVLPVFARSRLIADALVFSYTGGSYFSRLDTISPVDNTQAPTGGVELIFGNSGFPINAGETLYIGTVVDADWAAAGIPMPAMTLSSIVVACSQAPGGGQTFDYAVMKNGSATGMTAQISGTGRFAHITGAVAFNYGDSFTLRVIASAGAATCNHSYSGTLE